MLPFAINSTGEIRRQIARRATTARLALGWTRAELAERSGVALDTLKRFEQTGQVSLERLLKIAMALGALQEFSALFPEPPASSLDELEARAAARGRVRARGRRARATSQGTTGPEGSAQQPAPNQEPDDACFTLLHPG